jgi:YfiH family protein
MLTAASERTGFAAAETGWRFVGWAGASITGAVTGRRVETAALVASLGAPAAVAEAEQVHGASIACLGRRPLEHMPQTSQWPRVPGCDAFITDLPGVALVIRSADCLPILFADPSRRVVGIAHAGWRGLSAQLPLKMLAALWTQYRVPAESVTVAIGPAIQACCYEVGPEFGGALAPFVRERGGRRTCDLPAAARRQLAQGGVAASRIADAGRCTACDTTEWFSLRREGPSTGRLASLVFLRP